MKYDIITDETGAILVFEMFTDKEEYSLEQNGTYIS
jgi:hypothetical protein